jgi:YbbR domain-containing protein
MMRSVRYWVTHNWLLKLISIVLAVMLWMFVATEASSEVGMEVPLEYRNIPSQLEITGDTTNVVQVRLRGSANIIRQISAKDVSTTIDLSKMRPGDKIVPLSPQNVQAPIGAEVIRVNPSSVRFNLERTIRKNVTVVPTIAGQPSDGFEIGRVLVDPGKIEVEGPESRVISLESIATVPIRLDRRQSQVEQSADLDVPDPQIRLTRPGPVNVRVEIRPKGVKN